MGHWTNIVERLLGLDRGFLSGDGEFHLRFDPHWPGPLIGAPGSGLNWLLAMIVLALLIVFALRTNSPRRPLLALAVGGAPLARRTACHSSQHRHRRSCRRHCRCRRRAYLHPSRKRAPGPRPDRPGRPAVLTDQRQRRLESHARRRRDTDRLLHLSPRRPFSRRAGKPRHYAPCASWRSC